MIVPRNYLYKDTIFFKNNYFCTQNKIYMITPKIQGHLITDIYRLSKEDDLLSLFANSDASDENKSLVSLLLQALAGDRGKANKILADCIQSGKDLIAYYPAIDHKKPKGTLLGTIYDGALYLSE